jgi:ribosome-associated protein
MNTENALVVTDTLAIPFAELSFRFSPSSGPGGQHANRAHTRATLLFDVAGSPRLDEETRQRLLKALGTRLSKEGVLRITAQDSRSQKQNRDLTIARLVALLADALAEEPPRFETQPTEAVKEKRVTEKKRHGRRKSERSRNWLDDL